MRLKRESTPLPSGELTLFKNLVIHEIDRGDALRFVNVGEGGAIPAAVTEVIVDPRDDRGRPEEQHVRVRVRRCGGGSLGARRGPPRGLLAETHAERVTDDPIPQHM